MWKEFTEKVQNKLLEAARFPQVFAATYIHTRLINGLNGLKQNLFP